MEYSHLFLKVENKIQNASNLGIQADGWTNLRYTLCYLLDFMCRNNILFNFENIVN